MLRKKYDVIGFANPFQDLLLEIEKLPETNTKCRMYDYSLQGGGKVATALVACGQLGLDSSIVGVVGDDIFGKSIASDFEFNHVDTSHLIMEKDKRTNFTVCIAERYNKGKEFIIKPGDCRCIEVSEITDQYIKSARVLHLEEMTPVVLQACDWIHEVGGKVSIDAEYYRKDIYQNYKKIDIFIGSETYFDAIRGEMGYEEVMRSIQKEGPEIVIFTFGSEGCRGVHAEKYFELPAINVDVVDTTGAGDVFHGAFLYGYLQGWDPERSAKFASGVSAVKCTRLGGRAAIPDLATVMRFLEDGFIDYTEIDKRVHRYRNGFLKLVE